MEGRGKDDSESFSLVHRTPPSQVTMGELDVSILLLKITCNLRPRQTSAFHECQNHLFLLLRLAVDTSSCHIPASFVMPSGFLLFFQLFFLRLGLL